MPGAIMLAPNPIIPNMTPGGNSDPYYEVQLYYSLYRFSQCTSSWTPKVETLETAVQYIHNLMEELEELRFFSNEPSDGIYSVAKQLWQSKYSKHVRTGRYSDN